MKKGLLFLSVLPLLAKTEYLLYVWRHSPLDRWDWIFAVLFAIGCGIGMFRERRSATGWQPGFVVVIIGALILWGYGLVKPVHALAILGGAVLPWGVLGLGSGWPVAHALLPSFGILLLGCPGSSYWLNYFFGLPGFEIKLLAAAALAVWQIRIWRGSHRMAPEPLAFGAGALLVLLIYGWTPENYIAREPWQPDFAASRHDGFVGREVRPDESDRYIAGDSEVRRFFFAGDGGQELDVLAMRSIRNIHRIHPASHCLRTSGNRIVAEQLREENWDGRKSRQVNEIIAENAVGKTLFWVWYSSPTASSGNFLFFRYAYAAGADWQVFQLATPLRDQPENARALLRRFLSGATVSSPSSTAR